MRGALDLGLESALYQLSSLRQVGRRIATATHRAGRTGRGGDIANPAISNPSCPSMEGEEIRLVLPSGRRAEEMLLGLLCWNIRAAAMIAALA
jgi:hypothetical protein